MLFDPNMNSVIRGMLLRRVDRYGGPFHRQQRGEDYTVAGPDYESCVGVVAAVWALSTAASAQRNTKISCSLVIFDMIWIEQRSNQINEGGLFSTGSGNVVPPAAAGRIVAEHQLPIAGIGGHGMSSSSRTEPGPATLSGRTLPASVTAQFDTVIRNSVSTYAAPFGSAGANVSQSCWSHVAVRAGFRGDRDLVAGGYGG